MRNNDFNMKNEILLSSNDLDSRLLEIETEQSSNGYLKRIPASNTRRIMLTKDSQILDH